MCSIATHTHTHAPLFGYSQYADLIANPPLSRTRTTGVFAGLPSKPEPKGAMTLPRNSSPERKAAPPGAQDGMGTRATGKKDHLAKCGTESISHQYRAHRKAVVSQGCKMGKVARGASPPAAAVHLPAVARLSPAWRGRCLRFGEGFPSHITRRGSRRHTDASAGSGAAVLFRPVPVGSRVLAGTEITMQRAEAARRSRAETAGATPHSGTAAAAARH